MKTRANALFLLSVLISFRTMALPGYALVTECDWFKTGPLKLVNCSNNSSVIVDNGNVSGACFSTDGQKIAYPKGGKIYVVNPDLGGTPIVHNINCGNDAALTWVEQDGKTYIYWTNGTSEARRVELGTNTVDVVFKNHPIIWGRFSADGKRAGMSIDNTWDPYSINIETGGVRYVGHNTGCRPGISMDGAWVCGNTGGHTDGVVCTFWDHSNVHIITSPGGKEFNMHIFSHTSPDYMVYTVDVRNAYVCHWPTDTKYFVGSGYIRDYFNGEFGTSVPIVEKPGISPNGGTVTGSSVAVTITCATTGAQIRYTVDGSDPTSQTGTVVTSGATVQVAIASGSQTVIKARAFKDGMDDSPIASATFTNESLRDPDSPINAFPGLAYSYYEGTFSSLGALTSATPVKEGSVPNFDISIAAVADNFGIVFTGYITVDADAVYTFYTTSNDSSELYIGDKLVVANNWSHGEQQGAIGLKQGSHEITVRYLQETAGKALAVSYSGLGLLKQAVPEIALTHEVSGAPITVLTPNGGEHYTVGDVISVTWETQCALVPNVSIYISFDSGDNWFIADASGSFDCSNPSTWGTFSWTIPAVILGTSTVSDNCLIRIAQYNGDMTDESNAVFSIRAPTGAAVTGLQPSGMTGHPAAQAVYYTIDGKKYDDDIIRRAPPTGMLLRKTEDGQAKKLMCR